MHYIYPHFSTTNAPSFVLTSLNGLAHPYTNPRSTNESHSSFDACGLICSPFEMRTACRKIKQFNSTMLIKSPQCGHCTMIDIYSFVYYFYFVSLFLTIFLFSLSIKFIKTFTRPLLKCNP